MKYKRKNKTEKKIYGQFIQILSLTYFSLPCFFSYSYSYEKEVLQDLQGITVFKLIIFLILTVGFCVCAEENVKCIHLNSFKHC